MTGSANSAGVRARIKALEAQMDRPIHGENEAEEHARELDADEVAARAERKGREHEAAEHEPESLDDSR